MSMSCENCRFYDPLGAPTWTRGGDRSYDGRCLRYPPVQNTVELGQVSWVFPAVVKDDVCGEWRSNVG